MDLGWAPRDPELAVRHEGGFLIEVWRWRQDGTRYEVIVVRGPGTTLLLDERTGNWMRLTEGAPGEPTAYAYLAEKLRLLEGDEEGMRRLLAAALNRRVF